MRVASQVGPGPETRTPLSRERVLRAAVKIADEGGIGSLTMRRLADDLGSEAMSLYYHVAKKDDVLDGMVEILATEINEVVDRLAAPAAGAGWKKAVRERILSARGVLLRHPWAPGVLESRTSVNPAVLRYFDGLLGMLRAGGFSYDQAHHAMHALGSRALGFTQELFTPAGPTPPGNIAAGNTAAPGPAAVPDEQLAGQFPHLAAMLMEIAHDNPDATLGWCDDQTEFEFGLDLILDGLDRLRGQA
jgi:AcrR family transcriptional regulator